MYGILPYNGKRPKPASLQKILLVMKLTFVLLLTALLQVHAGSFAQNVTLKQKNITLDQLFKAIKQQTGYDFLYSPQMLEKAKPININAKNTPLEKVLDDCFSDEPLTYTIDQKTIIVREKEPTFLGNLKEKVKELIANIDVRGRVVDESGLPLPGATVTVKGTSNVTATDVNGYFTLRNIDPNATIVLTSIGFEKQELPAKAEMGTIKMKTAESKLDEVQVIAYGKQTQRFSVGNVSTVSGETIQQQPVQNPLIALQGLVPGLYITQNSGVAGAGVTVRIEGQNSINAGNDPLYVIDGVPYVSQMLPTTSGYYNVLGSSGASLLQPGGVGNPLSYINPSDIESISVLKDADATAIYGSRAANGAVLITTKKGKAGKMTATFNIRQGYGAISREVPLMNTQQYLQMRHEALKNDGKTISSSDYDLQNNFGWDTTRNTDWQKVLIGNTAHYNEYNAAVSGGNNNLNYLMSGTFNRETSVFPGNFADQRAGLHFNIGSSSQDQKLHLELTGEYLVDVNKLPAGDLTYYASTTPPDAPLLYNPDGSINWALNGAGSSTWHFGNNPIASYALATYQNTTNNLIANGLLSYKILPGLSFKTNLGYTNLQTNEYIAMPTTAFQPLYIALGIFTNSAIYSNSNINSWIVEPQLLFDHSFDKSKLNVLLGWTAQQSVSSGLNETGSQYVSDSLLPAINNAGIVTINSVLQTVYKYNAAFARVNEVWDNKYVINATARLDGSSRFGSKNQFHDFYSVGGAWIFSEEKPIKSVLPFLNYGKMNVSYGTTGNDQIGDYQFLNLYNSATQNPYQGQKGLATGSLPNPYLQWELTRKLLIGTDLGFFKDNHLLLTVNYSRNRSSNELLRYSLPSIAGFGSVLENFPATVQNSTWEFSFNSVNIKSERLKWSTNINLTIPENKLIAFPNLINSTYVNVLSVGQPISSTHLYHFMGVNPTTGLFQFADPNGQPVANPSNLTTFVNTSPQFYAGLHNSITYKGFQLDFILQFTKQVGPSFAYGYYAFSPGTALVNQPVYVLSSQWQKPGDIALNEKFTTQTPATYHLLQGSDAFYQDASYVRLQNLSLSYSLGQAFEQTMHLKNTRVFFQGQNLITVTKYKGADPANPGGIAYNIPALRLFTIGFQTGL